jgi:hypothetical protein
MSAPRRPNSEPQARAWWLANAGREMGVARLVAQGRPAKKRRSRSRVVDMLCANAAACVLVGLLDPTVDTDSARVNTPPASNV